MEPFVTEEVIQPVKEPIKMHIAKRPRVQEKEVPKVEAPKVDPTQATAQFGFDANALSALYGYSMAGLGVVPGYPGYLPMSGLDMRLAKASVTAPDGKGMEALPDKDELLRVSKPKSGALRIVGSLSGKAAPGVPGGVPGVPGAQPHVAAQVAHAAAQIAQGRAPQAPPPPPPAWNGWEHQAKGWEKGKGKAWGKAWDKGWQKGWEKGWEKGWGKAPREEAALDLGPKPGQPLFPQLQQHPEADRKDDAKRSEACS